MATRTEERLPFVGFSWFCYEQRQRLRHAFTAAEMRIRKTRLEQQRQADLEWETRGVASGYAGVSRRGVE